MVREQYRNVWNYKGGVSDDKVMQESMDIAGTTAKEAEGTISGSVNALKLLSSVKLLLT